MDGSVAVVPDDVRVVAKLKRRAYTAEYGRRILKEADACATPGAVGALLPHMRAGLQLALEHCSLETAGAGRETEAMVRWMLDALVHAALREAR